MNRAAVSACESLEKRRLFSNPATYYVEPTHGGVDAGNGGVSAPWATISYAVQHINISASAISTIYVEPGIYRNTIALPTLGSGAKATIQPDPNYSTGTVYVQASDSPTLSWVGQGVDSSGTGTIYKATYTTSGGQYPQEVFNNVTGSSNGTFLAEKGYERFNTSNGAWSDLAGSGDASQASVRVPDGNVSNSSLVSNSFYYNVGTGALFVDLPTAVGAPSNVEISDRDQWVTSSLSPSNFDIESITFRYSNGGAINHGGFAEPSLIMPAGSTLNKCQVLYSGFVGVQIASNCNVSNDTISYNGETGLTPAMNLSGFSIYNDTVEYNNLRHFDVQWAAGGIKLIGKGSYGGYEEGNVYNNEMAYNYGDAFWSDTNSNGPNDTSGPGFDLNFYSNYVHDNSPIGVDYFPGYTTSADAAIKIEVSSYVNVYDNVITNNFPQGIYLSSSQHTNVYNNTLVGNRGLAAIDLFTSERVTDPSNNEPDNYNNVENNIVYDNYAQYDLLSVFNNTYYAGQTVTVSSLTRSGTVATATTSAAETLHTGDTVNVAGATQTQYNGNFIITAIDSTHFSYTVAGSPTTPATGTIKESPLASDDNVVDYNLYYRFGGPLQLSEGNDSSFSPTTSSGGNYGYTVALRPTFTSFSTWQSTNKSSWDQHSISASPDFQTSGGTYNYSGDEYYLGHNSPAVGAGLVVNLNGSGSHLDYTGADRGVAFDLGAFEDFNSNTGPADVPVTTDPLAWVDDTLPTGAIPILGKRDITVQDWSWVGSGTPSDTPFADVPSPASASGDFSTIPSAIPSAVSGLTGETFDGATQTMSITSTGATATFGASVYIDPLHVPTEIMIQFDVAGTWYSGYWGANSITFSGNFESADTGAHNVHQGNVPTAGGWVRLNLSESALTIPSGTYSISGLSLDNYGGQALWDDIGTGTGVFNAPVDLWSLNGNGNDSAGPNNATLVGNANWSNTKINGDFNFDGSSYFNASNSSTLNLGSTNGSQMSIAGWFDQSSNNSGALTTSVGIDKSHAYRLAEANDTGTLFASKFVFLITDSGDNVHSAESNSTYPNNVWHYVVGTYDGAGHMKLYVDGNLDGTFNWSTGVYAVETNTNELDIGRRDLLPRYFTGQMDEISLYSQALSSNTILGNFNAGGGLPALPTAPTNVSVSVPPGSSTTANLTWNASATNADGFVIMRSTDDAIWTQIAAVDKTVTSFTDSTLSAGTYYYEIYSGNTAGNSSSPSLAVGARTGLIGSWHLDEGSGSSTVDSSGYNNSGTLINSPTWTTGEFGKALTFNGSNQYVEIANSPSLQISTGALSIGGWFDMNATGGFNATGIDKQWSYRIVGDTANSGTGNTTWQFAVTDSGANTNIHILHSNDPFNYGAWVYVVGTYDGFGDMKIYVNGSFEGSLNFSGGVSTPLWQDTNPFEIGRRDQLRYFAGSIDQVQILNRVLSPGEISLDYSLAPSGVHTNIIVRGLPASSPSNTTTSTTTDSASEKKKTLSMAQQIGLTS